MPHKSKRRKKQKKVQEVCQDTKGNRYCNAFEDVGTTDWWELICLPYTLCGRFIDCIVAMCAGGNKCLVYWFCIQWLMCKLTAWCTPSPLFFPYYFYVFFQVFMLLIICITVGIFFGQVFVDWFREAWYGAWGEPPVDTKVNNTQKQEDISFRIESALRQQELVEQVREEMKRNKTIMDQQLIAMATQTGSGSALGKTQPPSGGYQDARPPPGGHDEGRPPPGGPDGARPPPGGPGGGHRRDSLRRSGMKRYCFKKSELFDLGTLDLSAYAHSAAACGYDYYTGCFAVAAVHLIVHDNVVNL